MTVQRRFSDPIDLIDYKSYHSNETQIVHSLQGEAFNPADPKLVVCALAGKGRHVHEEVLGLRSSPGRRLAQCSAHMIVGIFPLIAKEWTDKVKRNFTQSLSISY